MLKFENEKIT